MMLGYLHPDYAHSLAEFGRPLMLPRSQGWLLAQSIVDTPYVDASDCYPLFCCREWSALAADLRELRDEFVSLKIITDPFGDYDCRLLHHSFPDRVSPFKLHYIARLDEPSEQFVSHHHQRNALRALRTVVVEACREPLQHLDEWVALYANLIERHQISGLQAFSRQAFEQQFAVPGLMALRATVDGETVGMMLWFRQRNVAYYHLGAYSAVGYQHKASFALFWVAFKELAALGVEYASLGAGAGIKEDGRDGLTRFKRGWSNEQRTAYLCGRIFQPEPYQQLVARRNLAASTFFPRYRAPG